MASCTPKVTASHLHRTVTPAVVTLCCYNPTGSHITAAAAYATAVAATAVAATAAAMAVLPPRFYLQVVGHAPLDFCDASALGRGVVELKDLQASTGQAATYLLNLLETVRHHISQGKLVL